MLPEEKNLNSNSSPEPTPTPPTNNLNSDTQQVGYPEPIIQPLSPELDIRNAATIAANMIRPATPSPLPPIDDTGNQNMADNTAVNEQPILGFDQSITETESFKADLPPIQDNPRAKKHKWRKPAIIMLGVILLAAAGYFAYSYFAPGSQAQRLENAGQIKGIQKSEITAKTGFIVPNPDYAGYDKSKIEKCLNEMIIFSYEAHCGIVDAKEYGKVKMTLTFISGKLTDLHAPYLYQETGRCDVAELSRVNRKTASNESLSQPSFDTCKKIETPKGNTVYVYSLSSATSARTIASSDYYFIKGTNLVVIKSLFLVSFKEGDQTISAEALTSGKQSIMGFIDSMLE